MEFRFEKDDLIFKGKRFVPNARTFKQMADVLASKSCGIAPGAPTYFMYRQADLFGRIHYDITRILPLDLCGEHNKTFGHMHPSSQSGTPWPEVYEVLSGEAHFLLQKSSHSKVDEAVLLSAKKGDCLLIPPGYGHVTINPGKRELVLANLVSGDFESDYSTYAKHRGACFYEMSDGQMVPNRSYGAGVELRKESAVEFSSEYDCFAPFRKAGLLEVAKDHRNIEFLGQPEKFC